MNSTIDRLNKRVKELAKSKAFIEKTEEEERQERIKNKRAMTAITRRKRIKNYIKRLKAKQQVQLDRVRAVLEVDIEDEFDSELGEAEHVKWINGDARAHKHIFYKYNMMLNKADMLDKRAFYKSEDYCIKADEILEELKQEHGEALIDRYIHYDEDSKNIGGATVRSAARFVLSNNQNVDARLYKYKTSRELKIKYLQKQLEAIKHKKA